MTIMYVFLQYLVNFIECFIWWRLISNVLDRKYHKNYLLAAAAILFLLMAVKQIIFHIPGLAEHEVIGVVIITIYSFATIQLLFKNSLIEKIIWWGVYNFGVVIMELLTIIILSTVMKKSILELSDDDLLSNYTIFVGKILTLLLFELIIRKHNHRLIIGFSYINELSAVIMMNVLLLIGVVFAFTNKNNMAYNIDNIILSYFVIVMLITLYTVALIFRIERKSNEEMETKLKLHQIEMELKLNKDMAGVTDRLRKLRHDMNNHIGLIKTLVITQKYEELKEYIDQVYEDIEIANDLVITENKTLSVLLNTKKSLAKDKDIDFTSMIATEDINMPSKDLCTLLGNILDNAIEAAEKSGGKKYIDLIIQKAEEGCVISCENSQGLKPVMADGKFKTTKGNAHIHGIGTENIKDIVTKYHGDIHFDYDEDMFSVRVVIPI